MERQRHHHQRHHHHHPQNFTYAIFVALAFHTMSQQGEAFAPTSIMTRSITQLRMAAPQRLPENVDGPLYINSQCINCAACSMFAPDVFQRSDSRGAHIVHHQPSTDKEMDDARAALRACPVAAIRLENQAYRSHRSMEPLSPQEHAMVSNISDQSVESFPRKVSPNFPGIYFVGHHNRASFGAAPYLIKTRNHGTILMDSPKFSKKAVQTVEKITGPEGPSYMVLSHVDDSADHGKWRDYYPNMKRIFHSGDLGKHNWIGDTTLEEVEILQTISSSGSTIQAMTLEGDQVDANDYDEHEVLILHTPGHSPGSITLWKRPSKEEGISGVLFTGDTYAYTTRDGGHMTSFPAYGNDHLQQAKTLKGLLDFEWDLIAPGHGHVRDYSDGLDNTPMGLIEYKKKEIEYKKKEMESAFEELTTTAQW